MTFESRHDIFSVRLLTWIFREVEMDDDFEFDFEEGEDYTDFRHAIRDGDGAMAEREWEGAYDCYSSAAEILYDDKPEFEDHEVCWLLLSWANAAFMSGDFKYSLEKMNEALEIFRDMDLIVGNPFFHLRVGQCLFEMAESDQERTDESGPVIDNLARALICGGIEIYEGEDPKYLQPVLAVVDAPEGFSSWHDTKGKAGSCLVMLNESTGYLRSLFETKYSKKLPLD